MEHSNLAIVFILTVGLGLSGLLAYLARLLKLPVILGYLLAGYLIGPYSPGFVADLKIAEQLAEIGVILMLFGVGLHFKLQDLIDVKSIALPGAVVQTVAAAIVTTILLWCMGWSPAAGLIMGLAIGVASTVVLVRVLTDRRLLNTKEGHIAVGWLVVEDIFTVVILILLPPLADFLRGAPFSLWSIGELLFMVGVKFAILGLFMFTLGHKVVEYILINVARLRSQELFTLSVLALMFVIAAGSTLVFGTSIALGAFLAGMVIAKTSVRHQAAANALPLKDLFAVIFFLTVGMLFNPNAIFTHTAPLLAVLAVILIVKPLSAYMITTGLGYSTKTAVTIAISLAQIGEFSFILSEEAMNLKILPEAGFDLLVAASILSISINPLLFQFQDWIESCLNRSPILKRSQETLAKIETIKSPFRPRVVIIGFGPIGRKAAELVKQEGFIPTIIEHNIDTVEELEEDFEIFFGDATEASILEEAKLSEASTLIITLPDTEKALSIIETARSLNPELKILARILYISEKSLMESLKVHYVCSEYEALNEFGRIIPRLLHS